jgi:hypothetical protein
MSINTPTLSFTKGLVALVAAWYPQQQYLEPIRLESRAPEQNHEQLLGLPYCF